jgi:hypothetical protein
VPACRSLGARVTTRTPLLSPARLTASCAATRKGEPLCLAPSWTFTPLRLSSKPLDNNSLVTDALRLTYTALAAADYDTAERALTTVLDAAKSGRQHLRVAYMRAQIAAAREQRETAVAILEEAIDLAQDADELNAFAELSFLLASQLDRIGHWDLGAEASEAALTA